MTDRRGLRDSVDDVLATGGTTPVSDTPEGVRGSVPPLAYRRGVENLAGAAVLAIAAFWAVYLLPQRVSQRSQVATARTEDRHSGAMRILAVARRDGREEPGTSRDCPPGQVPHGRLLTGPMPVVVAQPAAAAEGAVTMDRPVTASQRRLGAPARTRPGAPASPRPQTASPTAAARAAEHAAASPAAGRPAAARTAASERARAVAERRAAAARRRLALTLTLLAASAIAWTAVSAFSLHVAVPTALTAALGGVLALGRRAVVAARRSDAELAARASDARPARRPAPAERPATRAARPSAAARAHAGSARSASVTGRAVHGSQTTTQMISSAEVLERASAAGGRAAAAQAAPEAAPQSEGPDVSETPAARAAAPAVTADAPASDAAPAPAGASRTAVPDATGSATDDDRVLGGFSLPRPTYTMKAAAPRREVAPLDDADVTTPANAAERAQASGSTAGSAEEPATTTEGLGLGLDAILARRRASGA